MEGPEGPRSEAVRGGLLVLGGTGFLGRSVARRALGAAASDDGPVTVTGRDPAAVRRLELLPPQVRTRVLDGPRPDALERLLDDLRPARVVNCAALASLAACAEDPERAAALNAGLPARVARWTVQHGARLVHVSTDLVFGGEPPHPGGYREDDPTEPLSTYGRTKALGEEAVLDADPCALVVRLPLLYGDSGGTGSGASDSLLAALEAGRRPTLFTDERRSPLEVGNAAAALVELGARPGLHGRLHVAGPDCLTRYDFGLLVLAARGLSASRAAGRVRASTRAAAGCEHERPRDVCLDAREARALLLTRLRPVTEALSAPRTA